MASAEDSRLLSSEQKSMLDSFYPSEVDSGSSENPTSPTSPTSPTPSSSSGTPESSTPTDSSIPDHFPSSSGTPQESSSEPEGASSSSVPTYSTDSSIPDHNPEESSGTPESGDGGSGDSGNSGDSGDDGEGITPGAAEDDCVYYPLAKITIKDGKVFVRQIARYVTPDLRLGAVIRQRNENPETEE